jgi:quercetin dioxygenase-like cupin family protein
MSLYFPTANEGSRHVIFPGVRITTFAAEKTMMSHVVMEPGAIVAEHQHPHEQVGMVLKGKAHFFIGAEDKIMTMGDVYRIPGNVNHRVVASNEGLEALDVFYPIREDYR